MGTQTLFLFEDTLPANARPVYLPSGDRAIYVRSGGLDVVSDNASQFLWEGSAQTTDNEITLVPEDADVVLWRWELASEGSAAAADFTFRSAPEASNELKATVECDLDGRYTWLMRCDTVTFPPGGVAFTHLHQGPGIRITLEGEISIHTEGEVGVYGPGQAWAEKGVFPVYAPATERSRTKFVRCFLLPSQVKGASSLRIVDPDDRKKPNTQTYRVLAERIMRSTRDSGARR